MENLIKSGETINLRNYIAIKLFAELIEVRKVINNENVYFIKFKTKLSYYNSDKNINIVQIDFEKKTIEAIVNKNLK